MSNLPVYDTSVRGESPGLKILFEARLIFTEVCQALPTILMKNGDTRVGPFAKLADL